VRPLTHSKIKTQNKQKVYYAVWFNYISTNPAFTKLKKKNRSSMRPKDFWVILSKRKNVSEKYFSISLACWVLSANKFTIPETYLKLENL
jgi:hypothetical protein